MRAKLLDARAARIRPGWDDKVLADWNGLMIAALSRAAVVFAKSDWLELARTAFEFVVANMQTADGRLWHSARSGISKAPATASDYANMIWAALRLHQATGEALYLDQATRWAATLDQHYWDSANGGYFTSADDTADVIVRLKSAHDDAVPSANTIQLSNLIVLGALTGDAAYDTRARNMLAAFTSAIAHGPVGHCGLLAATFDIGQLLQVKLQNGDTTLLRDQVYGLSLPGAVEFAAATFSHETPGQPANPRNADNKPTAVLCVGPTCDAPAVEPDRLRARLLEARTSSKLTA